MVSAFSTCSDTLGKRRIASPHFRESWIMQQYLSLLLSSAPNLPSPLLLTHTHQHCASPCVPLFLFVSGIMLTHNLGVWLYMYYIQMETCQDKYSLPNTDACSQHWNRKLMAALNFLQLAAIETNTGMTLHWNMTSQGYVWWIFDTESEVN